MIKTVACKFWADGKCIKGEKCTFIHATGTQPKPNPKSKGKEEGDVEVQKVRVPKSVSSNAESKKKLKHSLKRLEEQHGKRIRLLGGEVKIFCMDKTILKEVQDQILDIQRLQIDESILLCAPKAKSKVRIQVLSTEDKQFCAIPQPDAAASVNGLDEAKKIIAEKLTSFMQQEKTLSGSIPWVQFRFGRVVFCGKKADDDMVTVEALQKMKRSFDPNTLLKSPNCECFQGIGEFVEERVFVLTFTDNNEKLKLTLVSDENNKLEIFECITSGDRLCMVDFLNCSGLDVRFCIQKAKPREINEKLRDLVKCCSIQKGELSVNSKKAPYKVDFVRSKRRWRCESGAFLLDVSEVQEREGGEIRNKIEVEISHIKLNQYFKKLCRSLLRKLMFLLLLSLCGMLQHD